MTLKEQGGLIVQSFKLVSLEIPWQLFRHNSSDFMRQAGARQLPFGLDAIRVHMPDLGLVCWRFGWGFATDWGDME